jgi:hypothetical protein
MGKNRFNQGHAVPDFVDKFGTALDFFSLKVRQTANIKHAGAKGTERELNLVSFINDLLPGTYLASKGEVVDLKRQKSPQLDVVIFDPLKNFPFYSGDTIVLPAEALLASIEVKSKLNAAEVRKSQAAALRLKTLEPMKRKLGSSTNHDAAISRGYRYLHSLFAYATDITGPDWAVKELARVEKHAARAPDQAIDLLYVLKHGLIDTRSRSFIPEDERTGQALVAFYFAMYNFIDRENRRRKRAPYFNYASDLNRFWQKI